MADEVVHNFIADYVRAHFDELLALDGMLAEMVGGPPGFTLSSYAYEASTRGKIWARIWRPFIDKLAWWIFKQRDHCRVAYENQLAAFLSSLAPSAYA